MASSAEIGASNSRYTGNAGIGGGSFGSFQLDTKPIEDLARYTMLYNKAEYDQRQKDAEATAKEIADYTSYDLTDAIPEDRKKIEKGYDELIAYAREHPGAVDYRNKKEWAKFKEMRNKFENDLLGAKTRNTLYKIRQKEIQDATDPAEKARLQKRLNEEIAATDIRTPLKHTDKYDVQPIAVSAAPIKKVQVTEIGKNIIGQDNWAMPDMDAVTNQAVAVTSGLMQLEDFKNTEEFKSKTPQEQQLYIDRYEAQVANKKLEPIESAKYFNEAIKSLPESFYKVDASGNKVLDYDKLAESENGIIRGVAEQVRIYNSKMDEMVAGIEGGYFRDDFNNQLKFSNDASGLRKSSYKKINLEDGLSPEELVKMRILGISKAPEREIKIIETDDALQAAQLAETRRHNKATEGIAWGNLKLEKDKWMASMSGGETVKNGAMERAKRIYGELEKLADRNGVIPPEKVRQLTVEQLKYLGVEAPEQRNEEGKIISGGGFRPLDAKGEVAIQVIDGRVNVMRPKEGETKILKSGDSYIGLWDNSSSTNVFNMATNILNEELKTAGAKELNSYMAIDLGTGGVTTNVVGGGTTVSGATTEKTTIKTTKSGLPVFKINNR